MKGMTFNNKHSYRDFGLVMKSKNRPVLPDPKVITEEAESMNGSFDFSEANEDGKTRYKDRIITVTFSFLSKNPAVIRAKAHQIAKWLSAGEKQLRFDDETAVYYLARVNNKIDLENQIISLQEFTVQFKCRPFAISVNDSTLDPIQLGQDLQLGYGYILDMTPAVYTLTAPTTLTVYNAGDYVKPKLILNAGTFTSISFTCRGMTFSYTQPLVNGSEIVIDMEECNTTLNGVDKNENTSGDYFALENGDNEIVITGTDIDCDLTVRFNYLYL